MTKYQLAQIRLLRKMVFDFTKYIRNHQMISADFIDGVERNFQDAFQEIFMLDNGIKKP